MTKTFFPTLCAACTLLLAAPAVFAADALQRGLEEARATHQAAAHSQERIDRLDDETRRMLDDYRTLQAELQDLEKYNTRMQRLVQAQDNGIADLELQIEELEQTRRRILPLMGDMLTGLERFVAADTPFLARERSLRLQGLQELLDDPVTGLAEKYRRLLEAYGIEADYAYGIEAYTGELELDGERLSVDYLRLGRTGFYWLSPDGGRAGVWNAVDDRWQALEPEAAAGIRRAIRVARKQAPPELLQLPLSAAGALP